MMSKDQIKIEFEKIATLRADGVEDLLQADWDEIETERDIFPFALDWDHLTTCERRGTFKVVSARRGREILGYAAYMVLPHPHSRNALHAFNDVLYVKPKARGSDGVKLIRTSETLLKGLGVKRIYYSSKIHFPLGLKTGKLLERLGYPVVEFCHAKVIDG